jgi:hypothetical protein
VLYRLSYWIKTVPVLTLWPTLAPLKTAQR